MAKSFNWNELKASTRRIVHDTFAGEAMYSDVSLSEPVTLDVRWHNRIARNGELESGGYAEIVEGIERVIFDIEELNRKGVSPMAHGRIELADGTVLRLQVCEPIVGPIEVIWEVAREE